LLEYAKKHVAESLKSRDVNLGFATQVRQLRAEWGQTLARPN
jgi:hypothetical protein